MNTEDFDEIQKKFKMARELMEFLEIPVSSGKVNITNLYDVLMDEEKLRLLSSKLKLKAFW